MSFIPTTKKDTEDMLELIGVTSLDGLFSDIPKEIKHIGAVDLPEALSEIEADMLLSRLSDGNRRLSVFAGGGAYLHYVPPVVDQLANRSEFYTAYTPYQPEVSQGTLTAIFEFQTMMCRLSGTEVTNASMYDGATALSEAALMSVRDNKKTRFVISSAVNPRYREVLSTYGWANDLEVVTVPAAGGVTSLADIAARLNDETGAVIVQSPNYFGSIEDVEAIAGKLSGTKTNLIVVVTEPLSMALLKSPGSLGADIVCGEAQAFGNPVGFGGPCLGFLSAKNRFMRKMPGRLVGKTTDSKRNDAYVLTLQTREQHIRRDRATSNICTNQGLCALRAQVYLALLGSRLRDMAILNHRLAGLLKRTLSEIGVTPVFDAPYFNEFVVRVNNARKIRDALFDKGYLVGILLEDDYPDLTDCLLLACTELNAPPDIDALAIDLKASLTS
ncbi:MAG: aminomethyl-transferring glycine dehydrogenase subunit GcvPA [Deltaproteobacteria bacterium]|nr:aminomethyl-transferring glycine dehydrogenase subunit GcvPA [Candidatus Zymogenaceae bacterium]